MNTDCNLLIPINFLHSSANEKNHERVSSLTVRMFLFCIVILCSVVIVCVATLFLIPMIPLQVT